jgi:hypothetical protein
MLLVLPLMTIDIHSQDRVPPTPSLFVSTRLCLPALFYALPRFWFCVFVSRVVVISGERGAADSKTLSPASAFAFFAFIPR